MPPGPDEMPPAPGEAPPAPVESPSGAAGETAATKESQTAAAPPPGGSQVPPDKNMCAMCHTERELWSDDMLRLYLPKEHLEEDAHWRAGVNCHDCHAGDYTSTDFAAAHAGIVKGEDLMQSCRNCHQEQVTEMVKGVHAKAGEKDAKGRSTPLRCDQCHGDIAHRLFSHEDPRSLMFVEHQVNTCGECHKKDLESYLKSVHGDGLYKSGLLVTATCADCHGAHGIYRAMDDRSTLSATNVANTCGSCHRFIQERLAKSVHGGEAGAGGVGQRAAPGGEERRHPTCTSCHQGHDLADPETTAFRQQLPNRCGNCHTELSHRYAMGIHGQLTELGYGPAAKCSDCHGAHDILPVSHPESRLAGDNRRQTCQACHPRMVDNALQFDPHADHTNPERSPVEYYVYMTLLTLLYTVFGFFGLHSVLWFIRSLVEVLRHGRPRGLRAGQPAYIRFKPFHRTAHTFLLISFLGLALTGLPLKYSHHEWAKDLAFVLGGFDSTSVWHRIFGVVTFGCFFAYIGRLVHRYRRERNSGQSPTGAVFHYDSPLPTWRDVKDFGRMVRWFFGLGPKPTFERWAYWEKFDFWGACGDVIVIGLTGLILWFPNLFCAFLPGVTLNVAKVIHSTQALLATGFVFAIHFFNTHLRAEKFPADMSVLTGLVSEEEMHEEREEYLQRLIAEGRVEEFRTVAPSRATLWIIKLSGFVALFIGLALLAGMIVAALGH